MKKKLLLISILAVLFSLTGCGNSEGETKTYNKEVLVSMTKDVVSNYRDVTEAEANYYINAGTELEASAVKGFQQAQTTDKVGNFVSFDTSLDKVEIENGADDMILVSIICKYENRDVKVAVSYSENLEYEIQRETLYNSIVSDAVMQGMTEQEYILAVNQAYGYTYDTSSIDSWMAAFLYDAGITPYIAEECEVTAVYSKGELMGQAAQNTVIGMVTVFLVLIFISFIISLLKYVPRILGMEKKKEKTEALAPAAKAAPAPKAEVSAEKENLMDDAELVAVITAAIYAAAGSNTPANAVSKDKLVVRSIRRARS